MEIKVRGIILGRKAINEQDLLLKIFTLEQGRILVLRKLARRRTDLLAGLELFNENEFVLSPRKTFSVIYQVDQLDYFEKLRGDYSCFELASYFVEILELITPLGMENRPLYELLKNSLTKLNNGQKPGSVREYFEQKILTLEGLLSTQESVSSKQFLEIISDYSGIKYPRPGNRILNKKKDS